MSNKGVTCRFLAASFLFVFAEFTAFAWAMMERIVGSAQGWMSQG